MYKAVARRCTRSVHAVNGRLHDRKHAAYTVTDGPCTWPVHGRVNSLYMAVGGSVQTVHGRPRPCTNCVHGRTRAMHMVRTCREHGRVRSRYVAKNGRVRGPCPTVYVPYTWPCTGRVPCTRPSTRPSLRPVCTAVYVPCTRPCMVRVQHTARKWPCAADGHGRAYARVRGRVPCTCTSLWPVYTAVHGRVQTAYGPSCSTAIRQIQ